MTDDETIALGQFCETVRSQYSWRVLVDTFEQQVFQHFMTTASHETRKREAIFAAYQGAKDFLAHMDAFVQQKEQLLAPPEAPEWDPIPQDQTD